MLFLNMIYQAAAGQTLSTIAAWTYASTVIQWAGGSVPTLTATLGKHDVFGFIRTGANKYSGFIIGQNITNQ